MPSTVTHVLQSVLEEYALPWDGIHGVVHWARVMENGLVLAEKTGAKIEVVKLFAVLHDSRRLNDGHDPDHGPRAAQLAQQIRGRLIDLPDHEFGLLCRGKDIRRSERIQTLRSRLAWKPTVWTLDGSASHPTRLAFARRLPSWRQR